MADKAPSSSYHRESMLFQRERDLGPIEKHKRNELYVLLLVLGKFLYVIGLFASFGTLKKISIVQFLFLIKVCSSAGFISLQKPFSSGLRITKDQWKTIFSLGLSSALLNMLLFCGLTMCGPLRTILLTQHSDATLLSVFGVLLHRSTSFPSKIRGTSFFALGLLCLLFFDNDEIYLSHPEGSHHGAALHYIYQMFSWLGLPDHNGGIVVLLLFITLRIFYDSAFRRFAVNVGGMKRLQALINAVEACLLMPWALFKYMKEESQYPFQFMFPTIFMITISSFIGHFYIESVCGNKMDNHKANHVGSSSAFIAAMAWSIIWDNILIAGRTGHFAGQEHWTSAGAVCCGILFIIATRLLTHPVPMKQGSSTKILIGYTENGIPLYSYSGASGTPQQSITATIKQLLRQVLEEQDSRNIFFYLCLNLTFTGVELLYGVWTNSLGLISDGFHMLFDCSALVLGLSAAVMSRWKATRTFSYGYGRVEVLSGFINGLFLVVIAFFVFIAALQRLFDPPVVRTEKLLAVSIAGLVVNLIGIVAFSHAHSHAHGGKSCGSGSHGHGHSHSHHGHSHEHHGKHEHQSRNSNMQGVFLHVVADTLGSVGVITSSILIQQFGWNIADPICSLFIAVLIFVSVIPLLRGSSIILLLRVPPNVEEAVSEGLSKILRLEGVLSYREVHIWQHANDTVAGTIHVQIMPSTSEHRLTQQVISILRDSGLDNICVQVEKETYYHHLSQISSSNMNRMAFSVRTASNADLQSIKAV